MLTAGKILRSITDLALPTKCAVCGRDLILAEDTICIRCLADLPLTHFWEYQHNPMADALNGQVEAPSGMYLNAAALIYYKSDYKAIPKGLKYGRDFKEGRYFAAMLASRLAVSEGFRDIDLIMPVPLHRFRRWKRGYNQAEIMARAMVGAFPGASLDNHSLSRIRNTRTQTVLNEAEREKNVRDSFSFKIPSAAERPGHILLVDDVFTSGATTAACCKAIFEKCGGGVRISVATLAYAGND